jgi:enoyl-CoA hydratase/carnithine racemase
MTQSIVRVERDADVVTLVLHDPERRNAMTEAMGRALSARVGELAQDDSVRLVILTGSGRAFSAGGDLGMIESKARAGAAQPGGEVREAHRRFMRDFYRLYLSVRDLPCPTLAAINGAAIGAGLCVALACDLRLAARGAKLGLNFTRLGIHPGMGATWTLPRLVGPARAAELLFTGRVVDGAEAEQMGLVNRAVPGEELEGAVRQVAKDIAAAAPLAVRGTKRSLAGAAAASLDQQLEVEADEQARCYESRDLLEGLAAARERRSPRFQGS